MQAAYRKSDKYWFFIRFIPFFRRMPAPAPPARGGTGQSAVHTLWKPEMPVIFSRVMLR